MDPLICPWSGYEPGSISFCEERLCSWVAEPANTWSNIGFIIVGLIIYHQEARLGRKSMLGFAASSILLGLGSMAFHATGIFLGEFSDNMGMFSIIVVCLGHMFRRLYGWGGQQLVLFYVAVMTASGILLYWQHSWGIAIFIVQAVTLELFEIYWFLRHRNRTKYRDVVIAIGFFVIGTTFWVLDKQGVVCDPQNHIFNGHAIWHLSIAILFYFTYRFNRQFQTQNIF